MNLSPAYKISSLGDSAVIIDFGNVIDETISIKVIALFHHLQKFPFEGMTEAAPAYCSLSVFYDVVQIRKRVKTTSALDWVKQELEKILNNDIPLEENKTQTIRIPVYYNSNSSPDLEKMAAASNISKDEIIQLHTSRVYRVYMLGFLPGFAYMGVVDDRIAFPRKLQPVPVEAGSVGIAGKQTGIYPLPSPGGWHVIGHTPVKMFTHKEDVFGEVKKTGTIHQKSSEEYSSYLQPGDYVQFYQIGKDEFEHLKNSSVYKKDNEPEGLA
jgi:inhibitor of KinA